MRCSRCGNELNGTEKFCGSCGAPVGTGGQGPAQPGAGQQGPAVEPGAPQQGAWAQSGSAVQPGQGFGPAGGAPSSRPPKPKKKLGIIIGAVAGVTVAAAAVGGLVFALNRKDEKEIVMEAFEEIYSEDRGSSKKKAKAQVKPMEELFGLSAFAENAKTADTETSLTLVMDSCSDSDVDQFSGSGFRFTGKYDRSNNKGAANIGVIYNDMDLASVDGYFGDDTIMMAFPDFSTKVFTLDISEGLVERIEDSPLLGELIEYEGIDMDGLSEYVEDLRKQIKDNDGAVLDIEALMTRYKEGTKAREKFKEALIVEETEKESFSMDGKTVKCQGYKVTVSKDSMVDFLKTTTDFFLNDEELQDIYFNMLEQSVKLAEMMGSYSDVSASDIYDESMEEVEKTVDMMIDFLDDSLTDVNMDVYVDKKGRLAAVMGTTEINGEDMDEPVEVEFDFRFEGGAYLTQNMKADVTLSYDGEDMVFSLEKQGTYDGKKLTCDMTADMSVDGTGGSVVWTGTYDSESGDYDMALSVTADREQIVEVSMTGVVDELEKGVSFHTDVDELKVDVMEGMAVIAFSGEYSYGPLSEELSPLEGEEFDVLAADEDEWESVFMEFYMGAMRLMNQLPL